MGSHSSRDNDGAGIPFTELYQILMSMKAELAAVKARVDDIDRRLERIEKQMERQQQRRNSGAELALKWVTILLGMVLSFVAAMYGLGWRPP